MITGNVEFLIYENEQPTKVVLKSLSYLEVKSEFTISYENNGDSSAVMFVLKL